jgi:hypothetical protein
MRLKLAFSHTTSELFRVHAVPFFSFALNERRPDAFTVDYADVGIFLALLDHADVYPIQHANIVGSIAALAISPRIPASCEDVSFDDAQLLILLKGAIRSRIA